MRFSQRIGETPIQETIQKDTMTESFKNRLLNRIQQGLQENSIRVIRSMYLPKRFRNDFCELFGVSLNDWGDYTHDFLTQLQDQFKDDINFAYDFIEFFVSKFPSGKESFNEILAFEKSAYRFDDNNELISITDVLEIEELDKADKLSDPYKSVKEHLSKAKTFFSDRKNPDYKNTVAESVHAIEALCKIILENDKATLSDALKLQKLHPALAGSIDKLYGFSSDTVRHGNKSKEKTKPIDEHDARLILVTSHSIVNYLISNYLLKSS